MFYKDGSNLMKTLILDGPSADKLYGELGNALPIIAQEIIKREFSEKSGSN